VRGGNTWLKCKMEGDWGKNRRSEEIKEKAYMNYIT
jgi:hypothetical protein